MPFFPHTRNERHCSFACQTQQRQAGFRSGVGNYEVEIMHWVYGCGISRTLHSSKRSQPPGYLAPGFIGTTLVDRFTSSSGKRTSSTLAANSVIVNGFFSTLFSDGSSWVGPT